MKNKKRLSIISILVGASLLSACGAGDSKVALGDYWNTNPTIEQRVNETAVYEVAFEADSGLESVNYDLTYANGKYKTILETETGSGGVIQYRYRTEFSIDAIFTKDGEISTVTDSVVTEVAFGGEADLFRPISSYRAVESHSPTNKSGSSLESCYKHYKYTIETAYATDGGKSTATITDLNEDEPTPRVQKFTASGGKKSYVDNEQLILMLRAIPSGTSSAKIKTYSPYVEAKQTIKYSFDGKEEDVFEFKENGTDVKRSIVYYPVDMVLSSSNPGATQTAWVAKAGEGTGASNQYNPNRNIMLKLETPLPYMLGKLVYTLKTVDYTVA